MSRSSWSNDLIATELLKLIAINEGVMPTDTELRDWGYVPLASAIGRSGLAYREWAERLGAEVKDSRSSRSYAIEEWVRDQLIRRRHTAELTRHKESYDILVDGAIRVEVKSSPWKEDRDQGVYGYAFTMGTDPISREFDIGVLVGVDSQNTPERVYIAPAARLRQYTVTVTGAKQWRQYLNAWRYIRHFEHTS